jgi:homoserine kinase
MTSARQSSFEVRVPASTANMGAGFDCLGLALEMYLSVRATVLSKPGGRARVRGRGVHGTAELPSDPDQNLIARAMRFTADHEGFSLPRVRIAVQNEIPVAGGLGSSAAATVAGIALGFAVTGRPVNKDATLRYATEMEGHPDNVAAALLGGMVVTFSRSDGSVVAVRKDWPKVIRLIVVTPNVKLETKKSRAVLAVSVPRADAVFNLQRSALFVAALDDRRYDLLWDAMQDRLHQSARQNLIPGLAEALALPRMPGLLGIALSGAGPSAIALATGRYDEIGKAVARCFEKHNMAPTIRHLEAAQEGLSSTQKYGPLK